MEISQDLNNDLELTRANHFGIGFDYSFKNRMYAKIETYYQYLYNIPILASIDGIPSNSNALAFSSINLSDGYVFNDLKNGGTGTNYGIELTLERKFEQDFYFLINASMYESTYEGSDGITRSTRYNGNFGYNIFGWEGISGWKIWPKQNYGYKYQN